MKTLNQLRRELVSLAYKQQDGHLMSCLTALPILYEIYRHNKRAKVILSKGHAYLALVVVLRELGFNPNIKHTHPERDITNGVLATTGSLGHGLPMAIGMALAQPNRTIHVLLGDQECMEGTFWEGLLVILHFDIKNIVVHVDSNGYGATGRVFGKIGDVVDQRICSRLKIHNTKRGQGIKLYEQNPDWHKHVLDEDEYRQIMKELK